MDRVKSIIHNLWRGGSIKSRILYRRIVTTIDKNPLRSFFGLLGTVLLLIIVGNFLRQPPKIEASKEAPPKAITIYSIGKAPKIALQAKIEKSGALKLSAQSAGFVQTILHWEGEAVSRGQQLFWLSTNAQGGTIASASRLIAQTNYDFLLSNYDKQIETINKQRELAEKVETQADELRTITDQSLGDTRNLISLNETILSTLDTQLAALSGLSSTDSAVLQVQQARSGVMAGLSSLRSGLRNAEYQASNDQEPAKLAELQKDVAVNQLDLQEKSLALNKELSRLNLVISQISESLMYPVSPCTGVIERVYVSVGESVAPGAALASLKCDKNWTNAVVPVSFAIAQNVSRIEKSTAKIGDSLVTLTPRYISQEPTEGVLNAIIFDIPEENASALADGSSLIINVPVGVAKTTSIVPYIPLDAVYQTEAQAYIYVAVNENGTYVAKSKTVKLGVVYGSFVEVKEGLNEADQVIVDRNVLEGDMVTVSQ